MKNFLLSGIILSALLGCSAQYTYIHEQDTQRCEIQIDSLRDVPKGAEVHITPDCNVTIKIGPLRNGSSETAQILKTIIPLAEKLGGL